MDGHRSLDERLRRLLDEQDIKKVIFNYARGTDRLEAETLRACFHPDHVIDLGVFVGTVDDMITFGFPMLHKKGKDELEYVSASHPMFQSMVEFARDDLARAETYMMSISQRWVKGRLINAVGVQRLVDRFERRDGRWAITLRKMILDQYFEVPPEVFDTSWNNEKSNRGTFGPDDPMYGVVPELNAP